MVSLEPQRGGVPPSYKSWGVFFSDILVTTDLTYYMYNLLVTLESLKKVWGLSDIFIVFVTSSVSDFYVILQYLANASVMKFVETLDFHIEYVIWQDLQLYQVWCVNDFVFHHEVIIVEKVPFPVLDLSKMIDFGSTYSNSTLAVNWLSFKMTSTFYDVISPSKNIGIALKFCRILNLL